MPTGHGVLKNIPKAEKLYQLAIQKDPGADAKEAYYNLALLYARQKNENTSTAFIFKSRRRGCQCNPS